ncbi:MAG: Flap-structured DNA-binding and RNA-binding protein [Chaenotheca gracillima]|nr:MAG: Flap-structured DNA-binding and RNA-binding protein [Chaenotheca gracillima]
MDLLSAESSNAQYPDPEQGPSFSWQGAPKKRKHVTFSQDNAGSADGSESDEDSNFTLSDSDEIEAHKRTGQSSQKRRKTTHTGKGKGKATVLDELESGDDEEDEEDSDEDDNFFTLQANVADFQQGLRQRQQTQPQSATGNGKATSAPKKGGRRGPRGPRKPVEPSLEIKLLLSQANSAFLSGDYDKVEDLTNRIIQMNAEVYAAHALLSGVFLERGEVQMAIVASISAAHLRPKDTSLWRNCANLILENGNEDRAKYLNDAIYCYTRIIRINSKDFEARFERAALLRELGHHRRAARELEQILTMVPQDTTVLRQLAEVYIDLGEIEKAKRRYREHMVDGEVSERPTEVKFDWSDVNIYIELFGYQDEYAEGIRELKSLSRWLLGRQEETYWDDIQEDDREWDSVDDPRRSGVADFVSGRFDPSAYGDGLPLELRVKMGVFRLKQGQMHLGEAMSHFMWLEPKDDRADGKLFDYPDLFREVADALSDAGNSHEALGFYEPLQQVETQLDTSLYSSMARCYRAASLTGEAEQCYQTIIENDQENIEARIELARMYEEMDQPQRAVPYVNEVIQLRRQGKGQNLGEDLEAEADDLDSFLPMKAGQRDRPSRGPSRRAMNRKQQASHQLRLDDAMELQFFKLQSAQEGMRNGDDTALEEWMRCARQLTRDFRDTKTLYTWEHSAVYSGPSSDVRRRANKKKTKEEDVELDPEEDSHIIPSVDETEVGNASRSHRRMGFDKWLELFLEFALILARRGEKKECYEVLGAAYNANVYYHSHESSFLIQICWATCALCLRDNETICNVARWFMKERQFTTDAYRLFAVLNRLLRSSAPHYNSGASQKFLLRHIKAMDYSLVDEEDRVRHFNERAAFTAKDEQGRTIPNDEMDVALLMLYGQVLYVGGSYSQALHYFYRAYALDPKHPLINLHLALGYLHYSLKRQSDNRHYLIIQSLSFLFTYHDLKMSSPSASQRQEAKYNVARSFHTIGLTHLAIPYYEEVLQLSDVLRKEPDDVRGEDFATDAAFNLQSLYAVGGNMDMAHKITKKWLVL